MKVEASVENIDQDRVPSICMTCQRCDHEVKVFGRTESSEKRGLAMLREQCPQGEQNYYVVG